MFFCVVKSSQNSPNCTETNGVKRFNYKFDVSLNVLGGGGGGGNWEKQTPFFSVFDCFKTFSLPVFSVFPVFFSFFHVFFPVFPQFFPTFFSFFLTGLSPYFLTVFLPAFSLSFPISSPVFSCSFSLCFFASFFWSDVFRLVGLSEQQTSSKQADVLNNS